MPETALAPDGSIGPRADVDPDTGLPVIELPPPVAAALATMGWRRMRSNVENTYMEDDWVLDHVDPDGQSISALGYSIEPSGNHGGLIVHRGDDCNGPVLILRPYTPAGIPPSVVLATVAALKRHDITEIGRACPAGGLVTVLDDSIGDEVGYTASCSVCGAVGSSMIRHQAEAAATEHRRPAED